MAFDISKIKGIKATPKPGPKKPSFKVALPAAPKAKAKVDISKIKGLKKA